jgi:hypothetical protein
MSWSATRPFLLLPEDTLPPVLAEAQLGPEIRTIAVSPDGNSAALATSTGEGKHARSTVRLIATQQAGREIEVSGFVRDLLFSPAGNELFLIQLRPATKRRSVENHLLRLDLNTLKIRRELYLPATSRSLAHWPQKDAVLVACRNELRSYLLPNMRSGPLFRILGENQSVAVIDGSRIAIGQSDRLLVIDLSDPPGQEEMPTRDAIDVPSAILDLAFVPGGAHGLARLADDRVVRVRTHPLSLDSELPPAAAGPESRPAEVEEPRVVVAPPPPPPERKPVEIVTPEVAAAPPSPEVVELPSDPAPSPPAFEPKPEEVARREVTTPEQPQVRGVISGPGMEEGVAVVFFGPDNILREATRAAPEPDGRWQVDRLPSGRYRVVLDGGGGRVLLTDPRFRVVDVETDSPPLTVNFKILRSM